MSNNDYYRSRAPFHRQDFAEREHNFHVQWSMGQGSESSRGRIREDDMRLHETERRIDMIEGVVPREVVLTMEALRVGRQPVSSRR